MLPPTDSWQEDGRSPLSTSTRCRHAMVYSAIVADLRHVDQCRRAVAEAAAWTDRLDAVVNAAGVWTEGPSEETTEDEWDRVVDINLKGLYFVCSAAIPHLAATRGCIINMSSDAGVQGNAGAAVYCASKGGVTNLTRALALELAPVGIRVNAVCPATSTHRCCAGRRPRAPIRRPISTSCCAATRRRVGAIHRAAGDRRTDLVPGPAVQRRRSPAPTSPSTSVSRQASRELMTGTTRRHSIDRLIEALQRDGRASYADLADLVTLSPAATRLRVQRLLDAGVVKVVGVTDPLALGYPVMAALGVRVERNVRDVADRIADIAGVIYVVFTSGSFDLLVEVAVRGLGAPADRDRRRDQSHRWRAQRRELHLLRHPHPSLRVGRPLAIGVVGLPRRSTSGAPHRGRRGQTQWRLQCRDEAVVCRRGRPRGVGRRVRIRHAGRQPDAGSSGATTTACRSDSDDNRSSATATGAADRRLDAARGRPLQRIPGAARIRLRLRRQVVPHARHPVVWQATAAAQRRRGDHRR